MCYGCAAGPTQIDVLAARGECIFYRLNSTQLNSPKPSYHLTTIITITTSPSHLTSPPLITITTHTGGDRSHAVLHDRLAVRSGRLPGQTKHIWRCHTTDYFTPQIFSHRLTIVFLYCFAFCYASTFSSLLCFSHLSSLTSTSLSPLPPQHHTISHITSPSTQSHHHTIAQAYSWVVTYFFLITFEMTYGKKLTSSVKMDSVWGPVLYCNGECDGVMV
jgi:hypothetical protein